jgi:hypothetical protein
MFGMAVWMHPMQLTELLIQSVGQLALYNACSQLACSWQPCHADMHGPSAEVAYPGLGWKHLQHGSTQVTPASGRLQLVAAAHGD